MDPDVRKTVTRAVLTALDHRSARTPPGIAPTRHDLLDLLRHLGPDSKETLDRVIESAKRDPMAAMILEAFGPRAAAAAPTLLEEVENRIQIDTRHSSVFKRWNGRYHLDALEAVGPDPKTAVPILLKLHTRMEDPAAYLPLARVIKKLDSKAAREAGIP
jgi:hypothetical protein